MVTIVKHEWHQVDVQYAIELDESLLSEIYPDMEEEEIANLMQQLENEDFDIEDIINDADAEGVELEWEHQQDDMWTMRKGGYDVTYEYGDESSWVEPDAPPEPTHKCTNCKWTGQSYELDWLYEDKDGNELDEVKRVCPYCESDIELTPHGVIKEEEHKKRMAEIDEMFKEDEENE